MAEDAEILVYDPIGPSWAGMVSDTAVINALDQLKGAKRIHVRLNSPGGDAFMGISIKNALQRHEAKIIVHVDALAASAASIIAMGADKLIMHEGSMLMIHRAWSFAMGDREEFAKKVETLDKVDQSMIDIYHRKSGLDRAKVKQMVDRETWMTAAEAVDLGFADETDSKPAAAQARVPDGWFSRAPETVNRYTLDASIAASVKVNLGNDANQQQNPQDLARKARWEKLKNQLRVA